MIFCANIVYAQKVVTDPALTSAVVIGGQSEQSVLKNINDNHDKIATWQTTISANLQVVKGYEEKMYDYLSNISSAVNNAFEIKQAAELTAEIITSFKSCAVAASKHTQGVIYTSIVSKKTSKLTQEMTGIYSYISTLVLNKNTLLNSAERTLILDTIIYKLRRIKSEIYLLQFQIENYTLADLPQVLFPEEYYMYISGKDIADKIIRNYSK
jgi:hypothetical protein